MLRNFDKKGRKEAFESLKSAFHFKTTLQGPPAARKNQEQLLSYKFISWDAQKSQYLKSIVH